MLAKKTVKNKITLPKEIIKCFPDVNYFEVYEKRGRIILTPLRPSRANEVRKKLKDLGIHSSDVDEAISWARQ